MSLSSIYDLLKKVPQNSAQGQDTTFVAKQPIFDLAGNIWAYELLFRDPHFCGGTCGHAATSVVLADGVEMMRPSLRKGQRFFINFTDELLAAEVAALFPPEICTVEILETVTPTAEVVAGLVSLKKQGYMIALDDYIGQSALFDFIELADIIKVDVLGRSPEELCAITDKLAPFRKVLLAEKVEELDEAEVCRKLGFSLFQGYFFSKAELVEGKKLSPHQMTNARLLSLTPEQIEDPVKVAEIISTDVMLTYKLLKYINSVHFGLPQKVGSVEHAIKVLGAVKTLQWVYVNALAGMDASPMAQEIIMLAAHRAKFLEFLAADQLSCDPTRTGTFFLLGLFSLLERVLQMPFRQIVDAIPMDEQIIQALCEHKGSFYSWISLTLAYEQGDWVKVFSLCSELKLTPKVLVEAYAAANSWVTAIYS